VVVYYLSGTTGCVSTNYCTVSYDPSATPTHTVITNTCAPGKVCPVLAGTAVGVIAGGGSYPVVTNLVCTTQQEYDEWYEEWKRIAGGEQ
jgi:hypothetical protein